MGGKAQSVFHCMFHKVQFEQRAADNATISPETCQMLTYAETPLPALSIVEQPRLV